LRDRFGALDLWDLKVFADLSRQVIIDLPMARNGGGLSSSAVYVDGLPPALTKKNAAVPLPVS